eukprot:9163454-Pyramimonas_sp.AAC.2
MPTSSRSPLRPHLIANLTHPGHMTQCLESFRNTIKATPETWETKFQKKWTANNFVDTVLVCIATDLADQLSNFSNARLPLALHTLGTSYCFWSSSPFPVRFDAVYIKDITDCACSPTPNLATPAKS